MKEISHQRKIFDRLTQMWGVKPAPHYLRAESVLTNDKSSYVFNFKTTNNDLRTESKLTQNDIFVTTGLGLFIEREAVAAPGSAVLQSYPNPLVFVAAAGFVPAHLEVVYNGYMNLTTGSMVTIDKLPTLAFRNVPQTQQSAANANSQFTLEDLLYAGGEDIIFDGSKTQELKFDFPTFNGMSIASVDGAYVNKLVVVATGYIVKGMAGKAPKKLAPAPRR